MSYHQTPTIPNTSKYCQSDATSRKPYAFFSDLIAAFNKLRHDGAIENPGVAAWIIQSSTNCNSAPVVDCPDDAAIQIGLNGNLGFICQKKIYIYIYIIYIYTYIAYHDHRRPHYHYRHHKQQDHAYGHYQQHHDHHDYHHRHPQQQEEQTSIDDQPSTRKSLGHKENHKTEEMVGLQRS
jgi:hypothetical protein